MVANSRSKASESLEAAAGENGAGSINDLVEWVVRKAEREGRRTRQVVK